MDFRITPEWVAVLRRDVDTWDARVEAASRPWSNDGRPWNWPDMTPPLKYTSSSAELGPGVRRRRASTGMVMGSGRHPPSEVYSWVCQRRVTMQMRLPVHAWAVLSRGRESVETTHDVDFEKDVRCRERWREWDGERGKEWRSGEGEPRARQWTEWYVRRMRWTKRDGVWRGEWQREEYDRDKEWDVKGEVLRSWEAPSSIAVSAPWGSVPQEVLLNVMHMVDETYAETRFALGLVCRAWFKIYAPDLYCWICVCSWHVKELADDVSKPGSRIAQYTGQLEIIGTVPWTALPRLLKLLPRLDFLRIDTFDEAADTVYHAMDSHMLRVISIASRTTLTSLDLTRQPFSSTLDVLRLLVSLPHLSRVSIHCCIFHTASISAPLARCTSLQSVLLWFEEDTIQVTAIASMAQWWRWPHTSADPAIAAFPGLHPADAKAVFAIMCSIPSEMLPVELTRVRLHYRSHGVQVLLGVLSTELEHVEIELHVTYGPPVIFANARNGEHGARVEHIVIRLNTRLDLSYDKVLGRMDASMALLPRLRTVTLETPDAHPPSDLAGKLVRCQASGMLRLRTCKEAQQIAQAAKQSPSGDSEDQGVVSPLWYAESDDVKFATYRWLYLIDDPEQHKATFVESTADTIADTEANTVQLSAEGCESAVPALCSVDSDAPPTGSSSISIIAHEPPSSLVAQAETQAA